MRTWPASTWQRWTFACAVGLPGAEELDIPACLAWIDHAAAWARHQTLATLDHYARDPEGYGHSEGLFRALAIDSVLRRGMGVRYNADVMADRDRPPLDSRDDFLHGVIAGPGWDLRLVAGPLCRGRPAARLSAEARRNRSSYVLSLG